MVDMDAEPQAADILGIDAGAAAKLQRHRHFDQEKRDLGGIPELSQRHRPRFTPAADRAG